MREVLVFAAFILLGAAFCFAFFLFDKIKCRPFGRIAAEFFIALSMCSAHYALSFLFFDGEIPIGSVFANAIGFIFPRLFFNKKD